MQKRWIITLVGALLLTVTSRAQQDPQFSQYMFDRLSVNPAYAGIAGNLCGTAFFRQQWSGFDGAPQTFMLNAHGPLLKYNAGVGITAYVDQIGQLRNTMVRGHMNYQFKNVGGGKLGVGLYLGATGRSIGDNWIANDPVGNDLAIPDQADAAFAFDMGGGVYYHGKKVWAGLSSTQLPESQILEVGIQNARHYYLTAGYKHEFGGNPNSVLLPSILLKSDAAATQFDVNVRYLYNNQVWMGVSYRTEDAIVPMIGYQMVDSYGEGWRIGYSYDVTTSTIRNYSSGSHEIMLSYCKRMIIPDIFEIYHNPRFL